MTGLRSSISTQIGTIFGGSMARKSHQIVTVRSGDFSTTLQRLEKFWPEFCAEEYVEQAPIFILAAGWRSGSTLLQRMISGGTDALIWGEPYANSQLVDTMCQQFAAFDENWPRRDWFVVPDRANFTNSWVANLYPGPDRLKSAHRAFLMEMFAQTARGRKASGWGFKEVRLGIGHAQYLRWLFPNAKFLFLVRNPWDALASYKGIGMRSYQRWPDKPIFTPWSFGRMWRSLAPDFERNAQAVGALCVRFEDLSKDATVSKISEYLNFGIVSPRDLQRIGSTRNLRLTKLESVVLTAALTGCAGRLGYWGPADSLLDGSEQDQ